MSFSNPIKITENFSSIGIRKLRLICLDNMGYKLEETKKTSDIFFNEIAGNHSSTYNNSNTSSLLNFVTFYLCKKDGY